MIRCLFASVAQFCRGSEENLHTWLKEAETCSESQLGRSGLFLVLDRVATKLIELAKGSQFALEFQSLPEKALKKGRRRKGRDLVFFQGTQNIINLVLKLLKLGSCTSRTPLMLSKCWCQRGPPIFLESGPLGDRVQKNPSENAMRSFQYEQI